MRYLLFILGVASRLFSQTITYSFSNEFETIKKHEDLGFYKFTGNDYAEVYYSKGNDMIFQVFGGDFKNVKKQETVLLPENSRHFQNEGLYKIKENFFWYYSVWDKKTKNDRLFALPFDKASLKFNSTEIKLIETEKLDRADKYKFRYSNDSTRLLITYRLKPKVKRDKLSKDIIGFNLFDDKMNKLYAAEIEMPYSEFDMNNLDYEIDSRGNIYMLAEVKINNALDGEVMDSKEAKNAYRYELIRINQSNNTLQALKINLDDKHTNSAVLSEDLNHDIIITGYYSERKNRIGSNGAYIIHLEYNSDNSVKGVHTTYCEFPVEVLKAYENKRLQKKMEKKDSEGDLEADNLVLREVTFYPDGSMLIIGEEYFVVTHTVSNGKTTTTYTTYHYHDILLLKADKNGNTIWCNKIPKQQMGVADASFHHHSYNGEEYIFYMDNIKNIDLPLTEVPAPHAGRGGGYLTCVKIDKSGNMAKRSVLNIKEEDIAVFPRYFESLSPNLILDRLRAGRHESKVFKLEIK